MRIGSQLPSLNGATEWLNSREITNEDLMNDKPILIHFWSVSCKQCKASIDQINELRNDYIDKLHVIAVHMPRSEQDFDIGDIKQAVKRYNILQPIYVDNDHTLTDLFSNHYVPACYLFDVAGRLRHHQVGEKRMKILNQRVRRLLDT